MAERTQLNDGGENTVEFSPTQGGLDRPDRYFKTVNIAHDGTRYVNIRGDAKRFERVQVSFISSADATILNYWVENETELTWLPDQLNEPFLEYTAKLVNESRPMQMGRFRHKTLYEGTLLILEI